MEKCKFFTSSNMYDIYMLILILQNIWSYSLFLSYVRLQIVSRLEDAGLVEKVHAEVNGRVGNMVMSKPELF